MILQIITDPSNWDNSRLQVVGKVDALTGRTISPSATLIMAKDLPEPYLTTWHATVEALRTEGQGDWDIIQVDVQKLAQYTEGLPSAEEGKEAVAEEKRVLFFTIHRQFLDGTCATISQTCDAQALLEFFDEVVNLEPMNTYLHTR